MLPRGDVTHGSVDGDGSSVEAPHYLAHLLPVSEGVLSPPMRSVVLERRGRRRQCTIIARQFHTRSCCVLFFFCEEGIVNKQSTFEESLSSALTGEQFCANQKEDFVRQLSNVISQDILTHSLPLNHHSLCTPPPFFFFLKPLPRTHN